MVAVVGAGHVPGITRQIQSDHLLEPLEEIPEPSFWPKIFKWGIPVLIVAIIVYGFYHGGAQHSLESISIWVLANGILAALGAALALGHPLTVAAAFVAAPITSLNPMIAAGWVSYRMALSLEVILLPEGILLTATGLLLFVRERLKSREHP